MWFLYLLLAVAGASVIHAWVHFLVAVPLLIAGVFLVNKSKAQENVDPKGVGTASTKWIGFAGAILVLIGGLAVFGHILGLFYDGGGGGCSYEVSRGGAYREC